MIKLERSEAPEKLTADFIREGVRQFKETKKSVWNVSWLKEALLNQSHRKCAYCEGKLGEKSEYMEVEHFKDKSDYPDDVLTWDNLLPSCKHCNGHKSNHDVVKEPIVNPFVDEPKAHLGLHHYLYKGKDEKGKATISVLDLNDSEQLVVVRFKVGAAINQELEERLEEIESGFSNQRARSRFRNKMLKLMKACLPEAEYSAVCATELVTSSEYKDIVERMKAEEIWNEEFESMNQKIASIAM